jgi:hypothetical protein
MRQTTMSRADRGRLAAIRALRSLALEPRRKPHGLHRRGRWWSPSRNGK